tara:strand:- start:115 stop:579 length:465 start_codon:yes stop_codon:yes gene_type:complete
MKLLILVLLILLDFLSKKVIFHFVELNKLISLVSFIDITHIQNYGISFGLFAGIIPMWFIVLLGVIMIFILIFWMFKTSNKLGKWGLLLIISGGISNIGDRLINNYVLDFIFLHYKQHYWPAFNFADIYISVGVLLIIIENYMIFRARIKDKND